jgi:hypothetical protein
MHEYVKCICINLYVNHVIYAGDINRDASKKNRIITPVITRLENGDGGCVDNYGVRTDEITRTLRRGTVKSYADDDEDDDDDEEQDEEDDDDDEEEDDDDESD